MCDDFLFFLYSLIITSYQVVVRCLVSQLQSVVVYVAGGQKDASNGLLMRRCMSCSTFPRFCRIGHGLLLCTCIYLPNNPPNNMSMHSKMSVPRLITSGKSVITANEITLPPCPTSDTDRAFPWNFTCLMSRQRPPEGEIHISATTFPTPTETEDPTPSFRE